MGNKYGKMLSEPTPQTEPIPGREEAMTANSAGGYSFALDNWKKLERFLILGSEGGTYYIGERELTKQNMANVDACIKESPMKVATIVENISTSGRAFKNDPAEFVLARMVAAGGVARIWGFKTMPAVIRTGRTLLEFNAMLDTLGVKWPMSRRKAFARWYDSKRVEDVAYQVLKYPTSGGWSHKDLIRLCHPDNHSSLYRYITGNALGEDDRLPDLIHAWEAIKKLDNIKYVVAMIKSANLTWEFVPGQWQGEKEVWEALLPNLPYTALIRNLGRMTSYKMLDGVNENVKFVRDKLTNREGLRKARVHPMQALISWKSYEKGGHNRAFVRNNALTWEPNVKIMDALEDAFYLAFDTIVPSGKDMMFGVDVSGSMSGEISGLPIACNEAAAVMAMVSLRTEPNSIAYGFDTGIRDMKLSKNDSFASALKKIKDVNGGGTDCATPMVHALNNGMNFHQFVILTDSETYAGRIHPAKALEVYRSKTGIDAKLVVVGMTSNGFSIADPKDEGMLDVVGFDTSVPQLVSQFAQGL